MAGIVTNIIQNSIGGFVSGAITTAGGYAGDAVSGVGNLIENSGRAVGDVGIGGRFAGWGEGINSYGKGIQNATAPNAGSAGGATPVKKSNASTKKALPSSVEKKALPASKATKAIEAAPAKKAVKKAGYTPSTNGYSSTGSAYSAPAAKKPEVKKNLVAGNGQAKAVPETRSIPAYKPASNVSDPAPKYPTSSNLSKSAIPGYGAATKAGSVAGGYKPAVSKAGSVAGGYKPAIPKAGSVTGGYKPAAPKVGSVAGGYKPVAAKAGSGLGSTGKSALNKTTAVKPTTGAYAPPSKAGSVAGTGYGGGGKSFF